MFYIIAFFEIKISEVLKMNKSLQNALGIKSSQIKVAKANKRKNTGDGPETVQCRQEMEQARTKTSKMLQFTHLVQLPKKQWQDNNIAEFREVNTIAQGNVKKHPSNEALQVVEVIQLYKETFVTDQVKILSK